MSWADAHRASELAAAEAESASRLGNLSEALQAYEQAAKFEEQALSQVTGDKPKTLGITAVSAVSLFHKAQLFERAEQLAHLCLATNQLPEFASSQLKNLLQVIWTTKAADAIGVNFVSGVVLVGVKGGQVVYGGAPLDLIVSKVSEIQAVFYRTVEMLLGRPFRRHGPPSPEVQGIFTPWLFQVPAGSYQFAVRVQEPPQMDMFDADRPKVAEVAETFLEVMRAASSDPEKELSEAVPDADYRNAFLRLARNLSPTGKRYEQLDIADASSPGSRLISFSKDVRTDINSAIRKARPPVVNSPKGTSREIRGLLRGLHLDKDWLEVLEDGPGIGLTRVHEASEILDDVVGPMVNRRVILSVETGYHGRLIYRDIELDE